jgi:hypothetical protein
MTRAPVSTISRDKFKQLAHRYVGPVFVSETREPIGAFATAHGAAYPNNYIGIIEKLIEHPVRTPRQRQQFLGPCVPFLFQ